MLTYQDSRIIGYTWFRLLVLLLIFGNFDVLHIGPSKDDIVEFLAGGGYEILCWTTFCTERINIFQGNSRLFRIDLVKCADITNFASRYQVEALSI